MGLILSLDNSIHSFNTGKFVLDQYTGAAAAYSLRRLSVNSTNVVRVRRSVDNAEDDFTADEITDGTLLSWVGGVNLLLFSEQFDNPYYFKNLGTLTTNQTTAPDGSLTADLFTKTSGVNTVSELRVGGVYSSTGIHTYSIYVKQNVGDNVLIRLDLVGNTANATFNFSTKTISTVGANAISATATELSDGWFRLSLTGNVTSTAWSISIINLFTNPTNDSVYVWGAQLNEGATAGDYAPTTSNVSGYGYVTTWYDQSGNSNDATQGTAASQPKIVDAGVLVEENGKPAIKSASEYLSGAVSFGELMEFSLLAVGRFLGTGLSNSPLVAINSDGYSSGDRYAVIRQTSGISNFIMSDGSASSVVNFSSTTANQALYEGYYVEGGIQNAYYNNTLNSGTNTLSGVDFNSSIDFFVYNNSGSFIANNGGVLQEVIFYSTDQSSNRTNIETNINDYYSIYP